MGAFGGLQILLSQIPNFHKLSFLSIIAAVMSFSYASIGIGLAIAKGEVLGEDRADTRHVGADLVAGQQRPRLVAERGIADLGRAAAHQHDGLVAALLPPSQHHDLKQRADMERIGGAVEADIGGSHASRQQFIEPR